MTHPHNHCAICQERPANKTNSHIIPSFFLSMVSSVDGSYRRGKELLYTIGDSSTKVHLGRSVLEDEWSDSFDFMSDDRIEDFSNHSGAEDFIFCSHCEKKLGDYLESPWHNHMFKGRKISPATAYYFWVSILWRISFFEGINLKLPQHLENALRDSLWQYLKAKEEGSLAESLKSKPLFSYKVLYCKDYCRDNTGLVYYEYDPKSRCASFLLGDVLACFAFSQKYSFEKQSFYGLEKAFHEAPVNDGRQEEAHFPISQSVIKDATANIVHYLQKMRLETDRRNIIKMWKLVRERLIPQLPKHPSRGFVEFVVALLYDESVKPGEKITPEYFTQCFKKGLEKYYMIPFK